MTLVVLTVICTVVLDVVDRANQGSFQMCPSHDSGDYAAYDHDEFEETAHV